jgi:hypothetical protein
VNVAPASPAKPKVAFGELLGSGGRGLIEGAGGAVVSTVHV